jgi:hypothetical protein
LLVASNVVAVSAVATLLVSVFSDSNLGLDFSLFWFISTNSLFVTLEDSVTSVLLFTVFCDSSVFSATDEGFTGSVMLSVVTTCALAVFSVDTDDFTDLVLLAVVVSSSLSAFVASDSFVVLVSLSVAAVASL